jgi:hypothetical protein
MLFKLNNVYDDEEIRLVLIDVLVISVISIGLTFMVSKKEEGFF